MFVWIAKLLFCFLFVAPVTSANNWAVFVATSRFWSNYRESVNLYYFYETVRSLGIPDSRIVMFLGEDIPCNPRNPYPGEIFGFSPANSISMYPSQSPRVDVHGNEVNRKRFLDLISSRYDPFTPLSQRLGSDATSNIFMYVSGHSAVGYTKFQDVEDLSAVDIADSFEIMRLKQKYSRVFWMSDTCRAASLHNAFYSKEIACLGSSGETDKSYSHPRVSLIGQALIDKFTTMTMEATTKYGWRSITLKQLFNHLDPVRLGSMASIRTDLLSQPDINLIDYMGAADGIRKVDWPLKDVQWLNHVSPNNQKTTNQDLLSKSQIFIRHEKDTTNMFLVPRSGDYTAVQQEWNLIGPAAIFLLLFIYSIL
jgi:phosphatidylinositol glycan class K